MNYRTHKSGAREVFAPAAYKAITNPRAEIATCGECGRSWDDAFASGVTPAPSGRCPFEYQHKTRRAVPVAHAQQISRNALRMLHASRVGRGIVAEQMPAAEQHRVEIELTALAQLAAECGAYLSVRDAGQGHDSATDYAVKKLRAVRKALGFTYP